MNNENNNGQPIGNKQQMNNQVYNQQPVMNNQGYEQQPVMNNQVYNQQPVMNNQGYEQQPMMNNQGYEQQPVMNNQGYEQQPMMNNQVYNQQPVMNNQGYEQQPMMNNQVYNQQPGINNQNQNYNGNVMPNSNKKDNKMLFIILGIAGLIVIAVVVLIFVLNGSDSKGNTIHDYENGGIVNDDNNNNNKQEEDSKESISFQGFNIPKQIGYEYEIKSSDKLVVGNDKFSTSIFVTEGTLDYFKSAKDELFSQYDGLEMNPSNVKVTSYNGKEVLTIELKTDVQELLFYIMDAGNNYCFFGLATNPTLKINYNDIKASVSLLSNAKYTGETENVKGLEIKDLFE